jgi:hypothetical protein
VSCVCEQVCGGLVIAVFWIFLNIFNVVWWVLTNIGAMNH